MSQLDPRAEITIVCFVPISLANAQKYDKQFNLEMAWIGGKILAVFFSIEK